MRDPFRALCNHIAMIISQTQLVLIPVASIVGQIIIFCRNAVMYVITAVVFCMSGIV